MTALLFISFFIMILIGVPIAVALGIAALLVIVHGIGIPLSIFTNNF